MATANEIDQIVVEIEERGASAAAVMVSRLDKVLADIEQRTGGNGAEGISAMAKASEEALGALPAIGPAAEDAAKSWAKLVEQVRHYHDALDKKHKKNTALEDARREASAFDKAMRAANRVPTELQQAPKKLSLAQKAFQAFGKAFGPKATQGLVSTVETLEKAGPIIEEVGPIVAGAAAASVAAGAIVGFAAVKTATAFGSAVIEAQAYREDLVEAFKVVRRTQGDADRVLKMAAATSDQLGIARAEGVGQFLDLLSKTADPQLTDRIVRSLADLSTVDPKASIDGLTRVIGKIKAMGKISQDAISELSTSGLEAGDVYAQLAKITGKSLDQVRKQVGAAGGIGSDVGIEAVLAAINSQVGGGPAGSAAAAKADRNLSSLLQRVKDIPSNILFDVAVGPGIDDVKTFLRSVLEVFDGATTRGKQARQVVGELFNALIEGLTGNKVDTKKGVVGTFDAILDGARKSVPMVRETARAIRDIGIVAGGLVLAAAQFRSLREEGSALGTVWKIISPAIDILTGGFDALRAIISAAAAALRGDFSGALQAITPEFMKQGTGAFSGGASIGTNIVEGIRAGINAGLASLAESGIAAANAPLEAAKSALGIHSPSTAWRDEIGWNSVEGFRQAYQRGAPTVATAAADMARAGLSAAAGVGTANDNGGAAILAGPGARGGAGGFVLNFAPTIMVSGASSQAQAQEIGAAAVRGARGAWEAQVGATMRRLRYG